jgi:isocitrate/isopropylmalate dehydrogenase
MINIALLPGDGIGDEVLAGPADIARELERRGALTVSGPWPVGASSWAATGEGLPAATLEACEAADAILLGAVGDHPGVDLAGHRPELALIGLREHFDFRVSIRQVWQPGKPSITFVRNLLAGAYGGVGRRGESDGTTPAWDRFELEPWRIAELAEIAVRYVEQGDDPSLVSVDKANLLATSRLWRRCVGEVADRAGVPVRNVYVDRFAYELGCTDIGEAVVVTEGLFGDILSDLASGRAGSIAMCSSASIHPGEPMAGKCVGLFEPVHGSAPMRAGKDMANPIGGFLALAALLEWFPDTAAYGRPIRDAVAAAIDDGSVTYDLALPGRTVVGTRAFSSAVVTKFVEALR